MHFTAALVASTLLALAAASPAATSATTTSTAHASDLANSAQLAGMISTFESEAGALITQIPASLTPEIPDYISLTAALESIARDTTDIPGIIQSLETNPARLSSFRADYGTIQSLESELSTAGAPVPTVALRAGGALAAAGMVAVALL